MTRLQNYPTQKSNNHAGYILGFEEHHQDWVEALQGFGHVRKITSGDLILFQGEAAQHIGIIISGRASARINTERGDETWVDQFGTDDFFGHTSLLTETPIDFEIRADTDVKALFVPAQEFKALLSSDANFSSALSRDLAARLNIMMNRLVEGVTLSSPGRICAELLRRAHPVGVSPEKLIIRPTPVFVELALHINSTRETVSRTVNKLLKSGILSREPGALLIQKPEALQTKIR